MAQLRCRCGEVFFVDGAPAEARIACRCGAILRAGDAREPAEEPRTKRVHKSRPKSPRGDIIMPAARRRFSAARVWRSLREASVFRGGSQSPSAAIRSLQWAVAGYAVLSLALWGYVELAADRSALGMLLLFAPRWWLVFPWLVMLPAALWCRWPTRGLALAGALATVFGVAHFELPRWESGPPSSLTLRLVTYNTDRSQTLSLHLRNELARWNADVVVLQDCKTVTGDSLRAIATHVHITPEFCFASRWPIERVEPYVTTVRSGTAAIGRFGNATRYVVQHSSGSIDVYTLHLESPRRALWAARNLDFSQLEESILVRGADSQRISAWVRRSRDPLIVAGDFNLPTGSRILERDWGDLRNAFSEAGTGFGFTMFAGTHRVRIDHALTNDRLRARGIAIERGFPSEHQPVVVDFDIAR
jgi:vancomycin resistance protein VanJ